MSAWATQRRTALTVSPRSRPPPRSTCRSCDQLDHLGFVLIGERPPWPLPLLFHGFHFGHPSGALQPDRGCPSKRGKATTDYISTFTGEVGRQPTYDEYAQIMTGHTPEQLPVLNGIARDFGVFDHWF